MFYFYFVYIPFWYIVANSDDVKDGIYRIVFKPGVNSRTIKTGIINDDDLVEETEAFGLQLIVPKHHKSNGLKLGNISAVTVFIKDGMFCKDTYIATYVYMLMHMCIQIFSSTILLYILQ